jgi:protease-4
MNRKQIIGLIAAALVFTLVSISSMYARDRLRGRVASFMSTGELPSLQDSGPYVGVLEIKGAIIENPPSSIFFTSNEYDHLMTLSRIDEFIYSGSNMGILLKIDSPGGTVYESDELYLKLKKYREETQRPVYVYMKSQATSGGYYIAMASDGRIFANRNAWTGSIGVVMSLLNVKELYDKLGIKEIDITSGKNKTLGSSGLEMTDEQREILQSLVDESHDQFVKIVAEGRGMNEGAVRALADGRIYTAKQAFEHGLIDGIMTYEELEVLIRDELGEDIWIREPELKLPIWQQIARGFQSAIKSGQSKSDAQAIIEMIEKKGNGALMYYADFSRQ